MKFLQFIKQYLNNKMIVHASMAAFAVTSTMNVANFFLATHHHWLVASTAGVALGEPVITDGAAWLTDGRPVRVVADDQG